MAVFLALAAALVYGAADFYGGIASRRTPAVAVAVVSQLVGAVALAVAWAFVPGRFYADDLWLGVVGGVAGGGAVSALYAALAVGRMGVVSPITAVVGASIPVLVGLATGERPPLLAGIGVACAFVAVALVSANAETRRISLHEPGVALAIGSGACIGLVYVMLALGHHDAGLARLAVVRVVSIAVLVVYATLRRESLRPAPGAFALVAIVGALDMGGNMLYVFSTKDGLLAIVAVLTSLYPATTVFLARVVLRETLSRVQWIGVGFAAAGIALIAG